MQKHSKIYAKEPNICQNFYAGSQVSGQHITKKNSLLFYNIW